MACLEILKSQRVQMMRSTHSGSEFLSVLATPEGFELVTKSYGELQKRSHRVPRRTVQGSQARLLSPPSGGETGAQTRGAAAEEDGGQDEPWTLGKLSTGHGYWDERGWRRGGRRANCGLLAWDPTADVARITVMTDRLCLPHLDGSRLDIWKTHLCFRARNASSLTPYHLKQS